MQWERRRRDLPDANQPGLASLIERRHHSTEDLIILLAANLAQYRSFEEIRAGTEELGEKHRLPLPSEEQARGWLAMSRRELYAILDEQISGFARCSHPRLDAWADRFRLERRLPLPEVLLLLTYPAETWEKPRHQEYVSSVLGFFEKRASAATQRGAAREDEAGEDHAATGLHRTGREPQVGRRPVDEPDPAVGEGLPAGCQGVRRTRGSGEACQDPPEQEHPVLA